MAKGQVTYTLNGQAQGAPSEALQAVGGGFGPGVSPSEPGDPNATGAPPANVITPGGFGAGTAAVVRDEAPTVEAETPPEMEQAEAQEQPASG